MTGDRVASLIREAYAAGKLAAYFDRERLDPAQPPGQDDRRAQGQPGPDDGWHH